MDMKHLQNRNHKKATRHKPATRVVAWLMTAVLLALLVPTALSGCGASKPPALSEIYDQVVELIEKSYAVNDVLFGNGLPVYKVGSEYAQIHGLYASSEDVRYEYVTEKSPYHSISQIKQALEEVYSKDYLDSIYESLFDGTVVGGYVVQALFYEDESALYQSVDYRPLVAGQRIYDYASMRIVSPSNADFVTLELDSHMENSTEMTPVRLGLIRQSDGGWRLDTPTY